MLRAFASRRYKLIRNCRLFINSSLLSKEEIYLISGTKLYWASATISDIQRLKKSNPQTCCYDCTLALWALRQYNTSGILTLFEYKYCSTNFAACIGWEDLATKNNWVFMDKKVCIYFMVWNLLQRRPLIGPEIEICLQK